MLDHVLVRNQLVDCLLLEVIISQDRIKDVNQGTVISDKHEILSPFRVYIEVLQLPQLSGSFLLNHAPVLLRSIEGSTEECQRFMILHQNIEVQLFSGYDDAPIGM